MLANLVAYAHQEGIEAEEGFTPNKTVRWLILFNPKGKFIDIHDLKDDGDKRSRGRSFVKTPHLKFAGDTPMRQFLVDTAKYALLFGEDNPDKKLLIKHEFFLNLLREAASADRVFGVIADAISDEEVRKEICEALADPEKKAKSPDNVTFAITSEDGEPRILVDEDVWHDWWRGHFPTLFDRKSDGDEAPMLCLVTGEESQPARTHPKVKGLGGVGGRVDTTLISFNEDAFCSYGLEQSCNAALSQEAAQQYVAALNALIERGETMAGTKVLYWYVGDKKLPPEDDPLKFLIHGLDFGDSEIVEEGDEQSSLTSRDVAQLTNKAKMLLTAIRSGKRPDLANARYNALTLSGNSARVVIRDWMEGQFEDLVENIDAWISDLAIVRRDGNGVVRSHKFAAILAATVRDLGDVAAPTVAVLWHAAIRREPISHQVMAQTLLRVKIDIIQDDAERHARLGLLKAYCIRKGIDMKEELNTDLHEPAYLCGRIMAILASIQHKALPNVGAGVVQRYYAAASATPGLVLGRLVRQAQVGHLPKIDGGLGHWFEMQLAEVWDMMKQAPPKTLSLEGQTLFAMGYYQQKAKRYNDKTEDNSNE